MSLMKTFFFLSLCFFEKSLRALFRLFCAIRVSFFILCARVILCRELLLGGIGCWGKVYLQLRESFWEGGRWGSGGAGRSPARKIFILSTFTPRADLKVSKIDRTHTAASIHNFSSTLAKNRWRNGRPKKSATPQFLLPDQKIVKKNPPNFQSSMRACRAEMVVRVFDAVLVAQFHRKLRRVWNI